MYQRVSHMLFIINVANISYKSVKLLIDRFKNSQNIAKAQIHIDDDE